MGVKAPVHILPGVRFMSKLKIFAAVYCIFINNDLKIRRIYYNHIFLSSAPPFLITYEIGFQRVDGIQSGFVIL